jgi:hypothetical protein
MTINVGLVFGIVMSSHSTVSVGWMIAGSIPGRSKRFFLLQNVQIALTPNKLPIQLVPNVLSLEVKRSER